MTQHTNRILAIDLARGVSVIMVIIVHVLWIYGAIPVQAETWLGEVIHFIGKGTPMFLIAMGFSFILSRNQSVKLSIKRAFYIFLMGYLMNFLKFILPTWVGIMPDDFIKAYGWTPPPTWEQQLYLLKTGDILQLAGVSLLFMGIINKFSKNKYVPLVIALMIMGLTKVVHGYRVGVSSIDYVLDLLWGAEWNVYFAAFPWFSFILIGLFFGRWYKEVNDKKLIFKNMLIYGVVFLAAGGGLSLYNFEYHFGDYFHLGPGGAVYLTGFNLILLWLSHQVVTHVKDNKLFHFFYYTSKRVTTIYVIQWTIICWGMGIFGYQKLGIVGVLLLIPVFILLTLGIQRFLLDRLLTPKSKKQKNVSINNAKKVAVKL